MKSASEPGSVGGRVAHELARAFRPVAGEREQLVASLIPATPPALRIEEVGERRASHRSREIDGDVIPGAHGGTSDDERLEDASLTVTARRAKDRRLVQLLRREDDVLEVDQGDLLELTGSRGQRQQQASRSSPPHQNVASRPNVGRTGNIETPERTAGDSSYSKK